MTDERLTADKRHLHRTMGSNQVEYSMNERIAVQIVELTKRDGAAKMLRLVGVAAGTM